MSWLYTFVGIFFVIYLLLRVRVGVETGYNACNKLTLTLRVGLLRIRILPRDSKKQHMKKSTNKTAKQKKPLPRFLPYLPCALKALKRVLCYLRVDKLRVNVIVATPDPADTVVRYGQLNAAVGSLWGPFHRAVQVKDARVHLDVDLHSSSSRADAFLSVSWRISQLLSVLLLFLCDLIAVAHSQSKNKQEGMVAQYG